MPRYTIITPTILRESLEKCCDSVNFQTVTDWEHLVILDSADDTQTVWPELMHPQRKFIRCGINHNDWGDTCRHLAWTHATGEYIHYLDDDNYYPDDRVLEEFRAVTADWAIFPINKIHFGGMHFFCPPMVGGTDTGSFLVRREIGRWTKGVVSGGVQWVETSKKYNSDGRFAKQLSEKYNYDILLTRPLMVYGGKNQEQL